MATITGLTAERMLEIEAASVVDGEVLGDHLILTKHDGSQIDTGSVIGPQGPQGPTGPSGGLSGIDSHTVGYTLVANDANKVIEVSTGPGALNVPADASVNFPIGTQIMIVQGAAGQITITPVGVVVLHANPGLKLAGQWASCVLTKKAANEWYVAGNLVP